MEIQQMISMFKTEIFTIFHCQYVKSYKNRCKFVI